MIRSKRDRRRERGGYTRYPFLRTELFRVEHASGVGVRVRVRINGSVVSQYWKHTEATRDSPNPILKRNHLEKVTRNGIKIGSGRLDEVIARSIIQHIKDST